MFVQSLRCVYIAVLCRFALVQIQLWRGSMPQFSKKSKDIGLKRRRNTKECLLIKIQMVTVKLALCVAQQICWGRWLYLNWLIVCTKINPSDVSLIELIFFNSCHILWSFVVNLQKKQRSKAVWQAGVVIMCMFFIVLRTLPLLRGC